MPSTSESIRTGTVSEFFVQAGVWSRNALSPCRPRARKSRRSPASSSCFHCEALDELTVESPFVFHAVP
jgi:hypothetical protein